MAYTPSNNTHFDEAIAYYFDTTGTLLPPGGTNNTAANVGQFNNPTTKNKIGDWDVSNVSRMRDAFLNRTTFNEDIGGWNVSGVNDMRRVFKGATNFNQELTWDMSFVNYAEEMFYGASSFNNGESAGSSSAPLNWIIPNLQDSPGIALGLQGMFHGASAFNQRLGLDNWDVSSVRSLKNMFNGCTSMNNAAFAGIDSWDTSSVTDMRNVFDSATSFNQDLSSWDVSNVEYAQEMFFNARAFNNGGADLNWTMSRLRDDLGSYAYALQGMFQGANNFNQVLGLANWNISNATSLSYMFSDCNNITDAALLGISNWDTSSITDLKFMFNRATQIITPGLSSWTNLAARLVKQCLCMVQTLMKILVHGTSVEEQ